MVAAARAWLASLEPHQTAIAHIGPRDVLSAEERLAWFYTPTDHGGLTFQDQRPVQQGLAVQLMGSGLSDAGHAAVSLVLGLENVLDRVEGYAVTWGRERGRDPQLFYLRVFGEGRSGHLGWRFGGSPPVPQLHASTATGLSLHPDFLGSDPAYVDLPGGADLEVLGVTWRRHDG